MTTDCLPFVFIVCELQEPPPEFDGHVDVEDFWSSVNQELLCRGFAKSKPTFSTIPIFRLSAIPFSLSIGDTLVTLL